MYAVVWQEFLACKVEFDFSLKVTCDPVTPSPLPLLPPGVCEDCDNPGDDDQHVDPVNDLLEDGTGDAGEVSDSGPSSQVVFFVLL
jgi:hypothetical protein